MLVLQNTELFGHFSRRGGAQVIEQERKVIEKSVFNCEVISSWCCKSALENHTKIVKNQHSFFFFFFFACKKNKKSITIQYSNIDDIIAAENVWMLKMLSV